MFTKTDDAVAWQHVKRTRLELIAYLETLSEDQWNHDSLCDGWRVRDVLAHLILEFHYTTSGSWMDFVRSGFRVNRFLKQTAIHLGNQPTASLMKQFQSMIDEQHKPASISVMNVLVDLLIHEQDIRIPLGQPKDMDINSLRLVFSHWEPGAYNFGEKVTGLPTRLKGLKFTITDLDIAKGAGAEVSGNAQDVLLAMLGRTTLINKLTGEGSEILKNRLK